MMSLITNEKKVKMIKRGRKFLLNIPAGCEIFEPVRIIFTDSKNIDMAIKIGENTRVDIIYDFEKIKNVKTIFQAKAVLAENAWLQNQVSLLENNFQGKFEAVLKGDNSECTTFGQAMPKKSQSVELEINHILAGKNSCSKIITKAVLGNGAKINFPIKSEVKRSAENSHAQEISRQLILDDRINLQACPTLEINQKNTQAEHKFSASNLDENNLFYLRSRGLNKEKASQLIAKGFLKQDLLN